MADMKKFREWQNVHGNFMTPELLAAEEATETLIVELSGGTYRQKKVYGVSLIRQCENNHETIQGEEEIKAYFDLKEAKAAYIALRDRLREVKKCTKT